MLETIREFGLEQLEASGEDEEVRQRHTEYFLALTQLAAPELNGPQQRLWLDRLEIEHDNLRAVLNWALVRDVETALRLSALLARFWETRGHLSEGSRWLDKALAQGEGAPTAARTTVLNRAAWLAWERGAFLEAVALAEQAQTMAMAQEDKQALAEAATTLRGGGLSAAGL